jgi:cytidylate kinase
MSNCERLPVDIELASDRLTWEVGMLAGRLARFLAGSLPRVEGALAEGQAFLQALFEAAANGSPPEPFVSPLHRLAATLQLTEEEVALILLAGMPEEHEGLATVLRTLHPRGEARASVGLAAQLLCQTHRERMALRTLLEHGAVVASGLLRVTGDGPFFERSLQVAEALWSTLHGIDAWPRSIVRRNDAVVSNGLDEWFASSQARQAVAAIAQQQRCTVLVTAESEEIAFQRALALVAHAEAHPLGIVLSLVVDADLERLIQVHALVRGSVPVLRLATADGPGMAEAPSFTNYPGTVVMGGREGAIATHGRRPLISVSVTRLSPVSRERTWRELFPPLAAHARFLAARYPIEPAAAAEVAADLRCMEAVTGHAPTVETVGNSLRARAGLSLSGGVKLVRPTATWDNLILPRDHLTQLREAVDRLLLQSQVLDDWGFLKGRPGARGVRMLFAGPPGTGKTLAAEVIARALSVDLLVVDISRVVSKWIGETEKNLAAVFDTAERAQAVLFFDEADALFGKRSEVSDAHDRYANLETAYLLTRLERFEGLAVLATNFRQNIDPAFLRRLEFVIDFAEPDREQRHQLWRCHLPQAAPLAADVNLYELAALYPVVGGIIRNAAVAAGFLAAAAGSPILRQHFIHAIRREYEKAGRAFPGLPLDMSVS